MLIVVIGIGVVFFIFKINYNSTRNKINKYLSLDSRQQTNGNTNTQFFKTVVMK